MGQILLDLLQLLSKEGGAVGVHDARLREFTSSGTVAQAEKMGKITFVGHAYMITDKGLDSISPAAAQNSRRQRWMWVLLAIALGAGVFATWVLT